MKRWLLIVCVFASIGAVVNVLVAWWCVLTWVPVSNPTSAFRRQVSADEYILYVCSVAIGQEFKRESTTRQTDAETMTYAYEELRAGWPMFSLEWYAYGPVWLGNEMGGSWREPSDPGMPRRTPPEWTIVTFRNPTGFETLPTKPIWLGFVYNSSFFGLIAFLLVLGVRTRRRIIWRKSGRCSTCGYPQGSSPACTECGAVIALDCDC